MLDPSNKYYRGRKLSISVVKCQYCGVETEACIDTGMPLPKDSPPVVEGRVKPHHNQYLRPIDRETSVRPSLCEDCVKLDAENYLALRQEETS